MMTKYVGLCGYFVSDTFDAFTITCYRNYNPKLYSDLSDRVATRMVPRGYIYEVEPSQISILPDGYTPIITTSYPSTVFSNPCYMMSHSRTTAAWTTIPSLSTDGSLCPSILTNNSAEECLQRLRPSSKYLSGMGESLDRANDDHR